MGGGKEGVLGDDGGDGQVATQTIPNDKHTQRPTNPKQKNTQPTTIPPLTKPNKAASTITPKPSKD